MAGTETGFLVRRASTGDVDAFAQLVTRYQDMAVAYAFARVGDFHLAEDIAQEAFLQSYRSLHQLRVPDAFPGWFRRIIQTQCDRFTRRKRPATMALEDAPPLASDALPPLALAERGELQREVHKAILFPAQYPQMGNQAL